MEMKSLITKTISPLVGLLNYDVAKHDARLSQAREVLCDREVFLWRSHAKCEGAKHSLLS